MGFNIAIDGPAGAGKSTVAKAVADKLGFMYVDTGAVYRAMALFFIRNGCEPQDKKKMEEICGDAHVTLSHTDGSQRVFLNGEDVTALLRGEDVGQMASACSALPAVRRQLFDLQRDMAKKHDTVMDGRDIGTCILPDADVKIYLTASAKERARRREEQLKRKGETPDFNKVLHDIKERDKRDSTREISPLKKADDAVYIDSTDKDAGEVTEEILKLCRAAMMRHSGGL